VDDLAITKLHNAHCVCWSPLVRDCVFRDPEIPVSENPLDVETGRFAGMMTPQGLQIAPPEDSLTRLGIITNSIVIVNIVFRVCIAGCRSLPVRIQGRTDLFLLHGLLQLRCRFHVPLTLSTTLSNETHLKSIRGSNQTYAAPFACPAVARSGIGLNKYSHLGRV